MVHSLEQNHTPRAGDKNLRSGSRKSQPKTVAIFVSPISVAKCVATTTPQNMRQSCRQTTVRSPHRTLYRCGIWIVVRRGMDPDIGAGLLKYRGKIWQYNPEILIRFGVSGIRCLFNFWSKANGAFSLVSRPEVTTGREPPRGRLRFPDHASA